MRIQAVQNIKEMGRAVAAEVMDGSLDGNGQGGEKSGQQQLARQTDPPTTIKSIESIPGQQQQQQAAHARINRFAACSCCPVGGSSERSCSTVSRVQQGPQQQQQQQQPPPSYAAASSANHPDKHTSSLQHFHDAHSYNLLPPPVSPPPPSPLDSFFRSQSPNPPPNPEMRLRRRLTRLFVYAVLVTGFTAMFYNLLSRFFGNPPEEPGVNLNSAMRLGYKQLEGIPDRFVPHDYDSDPKRLVFVGDVHGMFLELKHLLAKIEYNNHTDHLVLTGDLVTKGPDSLKVVDYARQLGASCVRGNQDDRVLLHYHHMEKHAVDSLAEEELNVRRKVSEAEQVIRIEKALAKKMTQEQAAWLDRCPLILRADGVKGLGSIAVVHAGLVHGIPLLQQDPVALMTMRSIQPRSRVPSSSTSGTHWARLWNRREKNEKSQMTVIYGHYAAKGLDIRPLSKGLDSNCVRGGKLTALVASSRSIQPTVVQVSCRKKYP